MAGEVRYKPWAGSGNAHAKDTSPDTTTVKTLTPPTGTTAFILTAESNDARVTFDGETPSTSTPLGLQVKKDSAPIFFPFQPNPIKFVSAASGNSTVSVLWLAC